MVAPDVPQAQAKRRHSLLADPVALLLSSDGTVDAMDVHGELPWKQAPIENAMQLHLFE